MLGRMTGDRCSIKSRYKGAYFVERIDTSGKVVVSIHAPLAGRDRFHFNTNSVCLLEMDCRVSPCDEEDSVHPAMSRSAIYKETKCFV